MKRIFDLSVALVGLAILSPILLFISILVRINMGKPVFFSQVRPGKECIPFRIYKFRTMTDKTDNNGHILPNDQRMTRFGVFLRSSSIDELPELFNVIKGDMSLVGPRPLLIEYIPLFDDFQIQRQKVKPGITGWAQVNGRNALTWEEKFKLDVWYVENRNFKLDVKILWFTLVKVIKREGISHDGDVAMPRFKGNRIN